MIHRETPRKLVFVMVILLSVNRQLIRQAGQLRLLLGTWPAAATASSTVIFIPLGGLSRHRHREPVELRAIAAIGGDLDAVRVDVGDAEVVDLLENVLGKPELGMHAVIERSAPAAGDDVGDAVTDGAVVDVVVPLEDQADAMPLEKRMEDRLQGLHVALDGVGTDRVDRLVEERNDEPPRGLRLGKVGLEPAPLLALRPDRLLGVDRDEVKIFLLERIVEL